jgi:hypothetical protein
MIRIRCAVGLLLLAGIASVTAASDEPGRLPARWAAGARFTPVLGDADRHSIHAYFNTSPESPDGRRVLLYTSTAAEGYEGEIRMVDRATGETTVLARNVVVEDAHRAACQQWVSSGRRVVYHDRRDGKWVVVAVDVATLKERVLLEGRQVGFGQPTGDLVPVYGPHADPGRHRDLELLDVATGEVRTAVTAEAARKAYPEWAAKRFGDRPVSVFFPLLSPDRDLVVFKLATPGDGDIRSAKASERDGLLCYDLKAGRILWMHERWGHPAWAPDSASLLNFDSKGRLYRITRTGQVEVQTKLPAFPGSHPSFGPDGDLFTTDYQAGEGLWAVAVGSLGRAEHRVVHRFDNTGGSTSWRPSHPHPCFSPDGRRLYFNVSSGRWTRLFVAEAGREPARKD